MTGAGTTTIGSTTGGAVSIQSSGATGIEDGTTGTALNFGNTTTNPTVAFNGSGTFGTTTGAVSLNGNTTVATGKTFTVTNGLSTLTGGLTSTGSVQLNATGAGTTTIGNTTGGALSLQTASTVGIEDGFTGTALNFGNTTTNPTVGFTGSGTFGTRPAAGEPNGNTRS